MSILNFLLKLIKHRCPDCGYYPYERVTKK